MKTYNVKAELTVCFTTDIQAESLEEAEEKAQELYQSDMVRIPDTRTWDIYHVEEIEE